MALVENQSERRYLELKKIFGSKKPEKAFGLRQAEDVAARVEKFDMPTLQACLLALEVKNNVAQEVKTEVAALGADNFAARKANEGITIADLEDGKKTREEIAKIAVERDRRKAKNETDIKANNSVIEARLKRIATLNNIADAFAEPPLK